MKKHKIDQPHEDYMMHFQPETINRTSGGDYTDIVLGLIFVMYIISVIYRFFL